MWTFLKEIFSKLFLGTKQPAVSAPAANDNPLPNLIVVPKATKFEELSAALVLKYRSAEIRPEKAVMVKLAANRALMGRESYKVVAYRFAMPWYVVAAIHMREASFDFNCCLHNGERIIGTGAKTRLVPKGRGPFDSWTASAIDVLDDFFRMQRDWTLARCLYEVHRYNGFGYITGGGSATVPSRSSPYLWSMTDEYISGKYVADGKFDSRAIDQQPGAVALWKELEAREEIVLSSGTLA